MTLFWRPRNVEHVWLLSWRFKDPGVIGLASLQQQWSYCKLTGLDRKITAVWVEGHRMKGSSVCLFADSGMSSVVIGSGGKCRCD
eukprot:903749-Amphidinium_carterae.1